LLPTGEVLIQDEISGIPGSQIRWGMITQSKPREAGDSDILLQERNRELGMRLLADHDGGWKVVDVSEPPNVWDSPNRGASLITFNATVPDSGFVTLAVLATPGSCRKSVKNSIKVEKLDLWEQLDK
jgi:hypothetical protein